MKGPSILAVAALALLLVLSVLENCTGAPQRLSEKRNWTPQAMLYLKGAQGQSFISDQSRRKELADRPPPERRNPNLQLLTLPEAAALFLASLEKPQKGKNHIIHYFSKDVNNWGRPSNYIMKEGIWIKANSWKTGPFTGESTLGHLQVCF